MSTYRRTRPGLAISIIVGLFIVTSLFTTSRILYGATITYTYDNLNRLTKAVYGDGATEEFTYDPAGNRLTHLIQEPDTSPPTGSIVINNGDEFTNSATVTLTISADDPSGVSEMCVSNTASCSSWEAYAASKSWALLPGDGENTVYAWFKDTLGNANSAPLSSSIVLDTTPPTGSLSINSGKTYTNSTTVTLSIPASDAGSGVSQMCLSNTPSCSSWEAYAASRSWELVPGNGEKTIYAWFKDELGNANTTPYSSSVILDTAAPGGPAGLTATPTGWTNSNSFDISWTNPGDPSGISAAWYKMGTPPGSNSDGTRVGGSDIGSLAGLVIPSEGETIFYLWLEDGAGNRDHNNRAEITLRFDATKPGSGTIAINNGAAYATSLIVNLNNLGAIDTLSGISKMRFSNNPGGPWSAAESFTADRTGWDLSALGGTTSVGRKEVFVQYQDGAGNWSDSFSDEIIYQPPQVFPFFDDFSTDKGWSGYGSGQWERGPAITGGGSNGNPDPGADHTQSGDDNILGFAIGADYPDSLSAELSIISPLIDCSGRNPVVLKFWRYLNVEGNLNDHARIYVSNNGTDWVPVWENPDSDLTDNAWTLMTLDISLHASDKPIVFIKFSMGPTNASRAFSGWNIDDVEVTSEAVYPIEGTLGTDFKVWAPDLGVKKGKVLLEGLAQKVLAWTNEWVKCSLSKPGAFGICDLSIILGDKSSIRFTDGFTVMPPEIESITPPEGKPGAEVSIKGKFFGTKKGKVLLNYVAKGKAKTKSCKITDWYMNPETGESEIVFFVPAGIVAGTYPLKVINSVGEAAGEFKIVLP